MTVEIQDQLDQPGVLDFEDHKASVDRLERLVDKVLRGNRVRQERQDQQVITVA